VLVAPPTVELEVMQSLLEQQFLLIIKESFIPVAEVEGEEVMVVLVVRDPLLLPIIWDEEQIQALFLFVIMVVKQVLDPQLIVVRIV
jgi:hypothetical protein